MNKIKFILSSVFTIQTVRMEGLEPSTDFSTPIISERGEFLFSKKIISVLSKCCVYCKIQYLPFKEQCGWRDSNPHGFLHQILSLARLPLRHIRFS